MHAAKMTGVLVRLRVSTVDGVFHWVIRPKRVTGSSMIADGESYNYLTIGPLKAISVKIIPLGVVAVPCPEGWAGTANLFHSINLLKGK